MRRHDGKAPQPETSTQWPRYQAGTTSARRPTILLVEGDRDSAYRLQIRLTSAGFVTLWANNSYSAYELIDRRRPDVLMLDLSISMTEAKGLLDDLELEPDLAGIPTLIVGSGAESVALKRLAPHQPLVYLQTPLNPRLLALRLQECLEAAPPQDACRQHSVPAPASRPASAPPLTFEQRRRS